MRAHVLSIGSELILGHLTDTNATFLAQELAAEGIELLHVTQVGDDRQRIANTIRHAATEADLIVATGGVGPTEDDLTREAIADVVGQTPAVDPDLLTALRAYFAGRGLTMPERNAKQAWLIPAAEALPNPVGTAPGWFVRNGGAIIVAMPGVPREMVRMWREQALPRIRPSLPDRAVRSVTFKTIGIGESAAEEILDDLVRRPNPIVATYAKDDGVHVRVTGVAPVAEEAEALRDEAAHEVRRRLGAHIYADDDTPLPRALARLLAERGLTLGVAERGSGGRFGALLGTVPEAGEAVRGVLVRFDGEDAPPLAEEARERFGADLGLGLAVDVEPGERGLYSGTVTVALAGARSAVEQAPTRAAFEEVQRRAALYAAEVLRRALIG